MNEEEIKITTTEGVMRFRRNGLGYDHARDFISLLEKQDENRKDLEEEDA